MIPEQLHLEFEKPIELIDEAFIALDKISRTLNEPGARGISGDVLEELEEVVELVKESLSLE
jgi:histone H3/H4